MNARRSVLAALSFSALAGPWMVLAQTQRAKVGWLSVVAPPKDGGRHPIILAFLAELRQRGWTEGSNLEFEIRGTATGHTLAAAVRELVAIKPNVIVSSSTVPTKALRDATSEIPVVIAAIGDPVASGLVASLARPGGNVTGVSFNQLELFAKVLSLLHEMVPHAKRIDAPINASNPVSATYAKAFVDAARSRGLDGQAIWVREIDELERAIAITSADAMVLTSEPLFYSHLSRIANAAISRRLPIASDTRAFASAGGLLSYSGDLEEASRVTAEFVDRILRGGKPEEMPVRQVSRFVLALNLATARALGLTVPRAVLLRADEVIE